MIDSLKRLIHRFAGHTGGRVLRGGAVLGASSAVEHGLRLARNLILTRILLPDALGLMALVFMFTSFFESATSVGVKEAVIQSPHAEKQTFLNAIWWLSVVRSTALYIVAFVSAPLGASFYNSPELTGLLRVTFLITIANGLFSPRAYVALKQMRYGIWSAISLGAGAIGVITTIVMTLRLRNAWGLAYGYVAEAMTRSILSFILCPFLPGFDLNKEQSSALMRFAKGMAGLPILTLIFSEADMFVVGKLFSKSDMGFYTMASALAKGPLLLIGTHVQSLLLPLLAEVRDEPARVNRLVLGSSNALLLAGVPIIAFAWIFGGVVLGIAYGPPYRFVSMAFAIMVTTNVLILFRSPIICAYLALGLTGRHRAYTMVLALTLVVIIYPMAKWMGLAGAAAAPFTALFIAQIMRVFDLQHITGLKVTSYAKGCVQVGLLMAPVIVAASLLKAFVPLYFSSVVYSAMAVLLCALAAFPLRRSALVRQPMDALMRKVSLLLRGPENG